MIRQSRNRTAISWCRLSSLKLALGLGIGRPNTFDFLFLYLYSNGILWYDNWHWHLTQIENTDCRYSGVSSDVHHNHNIEHLLSSTSKYSSQLSFRHCSTRWYVTAWCAQNSHVCAEWNLCGATGMLASGCKYGAALANAWKSAVTSIWKPTDLAARCE